MSGPLGIRRHARRSFHTRAVLIATVAALVGLMVASSAFAANSWSSRAFPSGAAPGAKAASTAQLLRSGIFQTKGTRAGDPQPGQFRAGQVIVRFKPGAAIVVRQAADKKAGAKSVRKLRSSVAGLYLVELKPGVSVESAVKAYAKQPGVAYAQPNYVWQVAKTPNDSFFEDLWGLENTGQAEGTPDADIDATEAWDAATGDTTGDVIVAVVDTGIDYTHPDLAANIWTNAAEIPDNGIDDDANGYVDDIHGIDTVYNDSDPMDDYGHGTHCSGTIGAVGDNGEGVVGVNWTTKIMALKFLDAGGYGDTADAVEAIDYGLKMGADIFSNSWGGGEFDQALYDQIAASNKLFVFAAGNWTEDTDYAINYPSGYDLPNIVSVGASNRFEQMAWFSNYGAKTVDVFAPGDEILSTVPNNGYEVHGGTSMATPHVAGTAALLLAENPSAGWEWLKLSIMGSAEPKPAYETKCLSGARLNADLALDSAAAGSGSVTGIVSSKGAPVAGATVSVGSTIFATTDANGRYTLAGVAPGTQTITATAPDHLVTVVRGIVDRVRRDRDRRPRASARRQDRGEGDFQHDRLRDRERDGERLSALPGRVVDAPWLGQDRAGR